MPSVPSPARSTRSGLGRLLLAVAVAWIVWMVVAFGVLPTLIRAAYDGTSLPVLNGLITGQAEHPVDVYLDAGRALAWRGVLGIPVLGLLILPLVLFRDSLRPLLSRSWRRLAEPAVPARSAMWVAVAIGMLAGVIEGTIVFTRQVMEIPPPQGVHPGVALWLGPFVAGGATALLALPWVAWSAARRGGAPLRPVVVGLAALGLYGVLEAARLGLHPASALLLAAGLATVLGRVAASRPEAFVAGARRSAVSVGVVAMAAGAGMGLQTRLAERAAASHQGAVPSDAPNVLIVVWDAVRARNLGLHGYDRATSPRLDSVAERGVTFERAMAPSSWSLPSHATLFTGRHPHRLDVNWENFLDETWPTLAETLTEAGYRTGGFSGNPYYASRAAGVAQGFAHYRDVQLSPGTIVGSTWLAREPLRWIRRRFGDRRDLSRWKAEDINRAMLDWIDDGEPERPFFAFVNYFDAHDPYRPPSPFDTLFADPGARYWPGPGITAGQRAELEASYDGAIAYVDRAFGELLDAMDRRGLTDETLVIVTSDHGEQFGEADPRALTHGWGLYDWLLHVPLVMVLPDRIPGGVRVPTTVGLRDVPATVLDLTGLVAWARLPGSSLRPLWEGGRQGVSPALSWAAPSPGGRGFEPLAKGPMFSLREGDFHYIVEGDGSELLYDVERDPWERNNLATDPTYADTLTALRDAVRNLQTPGGVP